jgi:hypothetical protein
VTRPNRSGQPPPPYRWPSNVIKSTGVELAELIEDDLLIYYLTMLGFSFGEKQWGESISLYNTIGYRLI